MHHDYFLRMLKLSLSRMIGDFIHFYLDIENKFLALFKTFITFSHWSICSSITDHIQNSQFLIEFFASQASTLFKYKTLIFALRWTTPSFYLYLIYVYSLNLIKKDKIVVKNSYTMILYLYEVKSYKCLNFFGIFLCYLSTLYDFIFWQC